MIQILQATAPAGSMWSSILMFVALFAIMYFFMIRPQQKKQKEIRNFRNSLAVGQEVITIGGLHGTIKRIEGEIVVLQVATGVELKFDKAAINPTGTKPAQAA